MANINVNNAVQIDVAKKSQDVQSQIIGKLLEDNLGNNLKIQQQTAEITGAGGNLNIKA
jgi:hypothetical protein